MKRNTPHARPVHAIPAEKLGEIRGGGGNIQVYMHVIKPRSSEGGGGTIDDVVVDGPIITGDAGGR